MYMVVGGGGYVKSAVFRGETAAEEARNAEYGTRQILWLAGCPNCTRVKTSSPIGWLGERAWNIRRDADGDCTHFQHGYHRAGTGTAIIRN